jgi:endonuclease YncB( thermonuclease family)
MTNTAPSFHLKRIGLAAGALVFSGLFQVAAAPTISSTLPLAGPARIVDGDTIEIAGQRIRLEGIDAPEMGQDCATASGETWPCGRDAAKVLGALTKSRDVACDHRGTDKYGRMLAICYADGLDLNAEMVRGGYAWAFVKYSVEYAGTEADARAAKAGVWQGKAEAPWDFRHKGWQAAEASAPQGCAIKGNISGNGQIYHVPWSPWYGKVKIDEARGERWFCSEADAIAAGWRAALSY